VKGADWAEDDIVGAAAVRGWGGRVERVALVPGVSTTEIIRRLRDP
jgi:D-beta-D-heptose 7-phosphate kinase/D-beta-D-heptose 1-phosphate adenosyltransferase